MCLQTGNRQNYNYNGPLLIIAAAMLWGTTRTSQALGPTGSTAQEIGALRLLFGGFSLACYVLVKNRRAFHQVSLIMAGVGGFFVATYQLCFFCKGLERVTISTAITLPLAEPFTAALLGIELLGERLGGGGLLVLLLILSGLVFLVHPPGTSRQAEVIQ